MLSLLFAALWLFGAPAAHAVRDFVTRGKRLTDSTLEDGVVIEDIDSLVAAASATLGRTVGRETYALARMVRSEYGSGPVAAKVAMAWVAVNDAADIGRDIVWTLNAGDRQGERFGSQAGGQRYGTSQDPYENDLQVAEAVWNDEIPDPTGGAVKFVHKNTLGQLPAGVAKWTDLEPRELPDTGLLVVFVRKGLA